MSDHNHPDRSIHNLGIGNGMMKIEGKGEGKMRYNLEWIAWIDLLICI
jgi:hypothetical protein